MAAYTRTRKAITVDAVKGTYQNVGAGLPPQETVAQAPLWRTTTDVVGNRKGDNPFDSEWWMVSHVLIDGVLYNPVSGNVSARFTRWATTAGSYTSPTHLISPTGFTSTELQQLGVETVAGTNPNVPQVTLPTLFVQDFRDIPSIVAKTGKSVLKDVNRKNPLDLAKRVGLTDAEIEKDLLHVRTTRMAKDTARNYLLYRWAYLPLMHDLKKLTEFVHGVEKRIKWFQKLSTGKSLHRRCSLQKQSKWSLLSSLPIYTSVPLTVWTGPRTVTTRQSTWGSAQWSISDRSRFPWRYNEQMLIALRTSAGLTPQTLTLSAWELIPWTWLVDWFVNIGGLLQATQNDVPVQHSRLCLMRKTTTTEVSVPYASVTKSIRLSGRWRRWKQTKVRRPVTNPQPFTLSILPFLEGDRPSILGSVYTLRRLK